MTPTIQLRALHAAQAQIRAEARRFNVLSCGRRFGKTELGLDEAIDGEKGLLEGYPVGWFAPNARFYEETWLEAQRILAPVIRRTQEQKKRLTLANGAVFECWDLEDPDSGRSRKYGKVIVDEAAKVPRLEQAWDQAIRPTLLDLGGNAWFLSSPRGFNYFKQLHDRGNVETIKKRDDWKSWTFPTHANPYIPADEIMRITVDMPELVHQQEILGRFVDLSSSTVQREWLKYGELPRHLAHVVSIGVDLAISTADSAAYTAIVVLARMADGRLYILSVRRFRKPFHAILKEIERAAADWRPDVIGVETNQFQAAVVQELVRTTNLPVRGISVNKDKLTRFQPVLARYEQGLVVHTPDLPREFEDELLAFPSGDFKDMVDALGLAYTCSPDPAGAGRVSSAGARTCFDPSVPEHSEEEIDQAPMFVEDTYARW